MSTQHEAIVRRFYEQMNNGRRNELAAELFTADHQMHDPQVPIGEMIRSLGLNEAHEELRRIRKLYEKAGVPE